MKIRRGKSTARRVASQKIDPETAKKFFFAFVDRRAFIASDDAAKAKEELHRLGVDPRKISAVLPGDDWLKVIEHAKAVTLRRASHQLSKVLSTARPYLAKQESALLQEVIDSIDRNAAEAAELASAIVLGGRFKPGPDWEDRKLGTPTDLSKATFIGDRCVELYDLIAPYVPAQRRQSRGTQATRFKERAMKYVAVLVTNHYALHGLRRLTPRDVSGHLQRRPKFTRPNPPTKE